VTTLVVIQASEPGTPNVPLTGSGSLAVDTLEVVDGASLSGEGALDPTTTHMEMSNAVTLSGTGELVMASETLVVPAEMRMEVLDDTLDRAPTVVTVSVFQAIPNTVVDFQIDSVLVHTQEADSEGNLYAVSLLVDETHLSGAHTITASQPGALSASATFTLLGDPIPDDEGPGEDVPPADPGVVARWVLQDPIPGGLGNFIFPANPDSWVPPYFERRLTMHHTVAADGQYHVIEGQEMVAEWSFSGFAATEAVHDALIAFHQLNRRFYVIDHRGRAWVTTFVDVDLRARTSKIINGAPSDWGHDYTVTAVAYWQTPAVIP
jgi:hypothetical protein